MSRQGADREVTVAGDVARPGGGQARSAGDGGASLPSRIVLAMAIDWHRVPIVPESRSARGRATRQRIIEAAADLFADRGVDGTEVAEILAAAGQRNASAIQYHFGSREGLIVAVVQPRTELLEPFFAERARMLDDLLLKGGTVTLEDAVEVLVRPTWILLESHAGRSYLRVAAQIVRALPVADRNLPGGTPTQRTVALIGARMPEMPEASRRERVATAFTLYVELIANRAREIELGLPHNLDADTFQSELCAMLVGLLSAPVRASRAGD